MVNIYLNAYEPEGYPVLALSIPPSDIRRLSIRPLKWLRFVTFTVCGAEGELSEAQDGPAVDYDNVTLVGDYYYTPQGDYHLIDYSGLNERITSSEQTPRRSRLREDVMVRDGSFCVFTGESADACEAAHIIPRSKGDEYISRVIEDRVRLYGPIPLLEGINDVQNGIFLRRDLHSKFGDGHVAFLKTPNFALDTDDIPRVEAGPNPQSRITLQHLVPPVGLDPIRARDAHSTGTAISPPPAILLDYMYGVAAYQRWGAGEGIREVMQRRFTEHYKSIPRPPLTPTTPAGSSSETDDSRDGDFEPRTPPRRRHHTTGMSAGMLQSMDDVLALSMWFKGITPDAMAAARQRREEEDELRAQQASQAKVAEWMQSNQLIT